MAMVVVMAVPEMTMAMSVMTVVSMMAIVTMSVMAMSVAVTACESLAWDRQRCRGQR
jgi:hypothetical protein